MKVDRQIDIKNLEIRQSTNTKIAVKQEADSKNLKIRPDTQNLANRQSNKH